MGLAEKRVQHEYENDRIPKRIEYFKQNYCPDSNLTVEVDWPSFGGDKAALDGMWSTWEQPFHGLEAVCSDDLGKQAVASGVKKIVIHNVNDMSQVRCELQSGVLHTWMVYKDGSSGSLGYTAIQKVVEDGL